MSKMKLPGWVVRARPIGSGMVGTVYCASKEGAPDVVRAIKVFDRRRIERNTEPPVGVAAREELSRRIERLKTRFVLETYAAPAHPSFVRYFVEETKALQGALADRDPVLVMEYLEGSVSLDAYVGELLGSPGEVGRPSRDCLKVLRELCRLGRQMVHGLHRAHAIGVVHRDLKPDNILVVRAAPSRPVRVKILDLGIAKVPAALAPSSPLAQVGDDEETLGTLGYMAPEQYHRASSASAAADVYGLGQTLLDVLAHRVVFWPDLPGGRSSAIRDGLIHWDRVVEDRKRARTFVTEGIRARLMPHASPDSGELETVLASFADLVLDMVRLEPKERPDLKSVEDRLAKLAREPSSTLLDIGVTFAEATYNWESTGDFPSDGALPPFLVWSGGQALVPSEQQFLQAFERHLSEMRERDRSEAVTAKEDAQRATKVAESRRRTATAFGVVAVVLALGCAGALVALKKAKSTVDETIVKLDKTNARLEETNSQLAATNSQLAATNSTLENTERTLTSTNKVLADREKEAKSLLADIKKKTTLSGALRARVDAYENKEGEMFAAIHDAEAAHQQALLALKLSHEMALTVQKDAADNCHDDLAKAQRERDGHRDAGAQCSEALRDAGGRLASECGALRDTADQCALQREELRDAGQKCLADRETWRDAGGRCASACAACTLPP